MLINILLKRFFWLLGHEVDDRAHPEYLLLVHLAEIIISINNIILNINYREILKFELR